MSQALELPLQAVIGFGGKVINGLHSVQNSRYSVYPLGSTMVVRDNKRNIQTFLRGHSSEITCVTVSRDGKRLASGQVSFMGQKADAIIWDLEKAIANMEAGAKGGELIHRLQLHTGRVQDLCFSKNGDYLMTLGGQDDNSLVAWKVEEGEALCGTPSSSDSSLVVKCLNNHNDMLVTAGNYTFQVWRLDPKNRKIHSLEAKMGQLKRIITSVAITDDDDVAYCGTRTGDILEIKLECDLFRQVGPCMGNQKPRFNQPSKERYSQGVQCIATYTKIVGGKETRYIVAGSGDGTVGLLNASLKTLHSQQLAGGVTSISPVDKTGSSFSVGTDESNMYTLKHDGPSTAPGGAGKETLVADLRRTCHYATINDIIFPRDCSQLFLTCSVNDVRVWNADTKQELLRIQVPNLECNCIDITDNGGTIVSGWNDGKIRAFLPESGRLRFVIQDAHSESTSALAVTRGNDTSPWKLISGGKDGRVRVWKISSARQDMEASMKEHRGQINCIKVNRNNTQCLSASADGSCILWDLHNFTGLKAFHASTIFNRILYHPDESQIITAGSDRKVTYWDCYDGQAIRVLDDASEEEMLALDIDEQGQIFVEGGRDKLVKIWHYDDGLTLAKGAGHSGSIKAVKISPDTSTIVSVGSEGAIFMWKIPAIRHSK